MSIATLHTFVLLTATSTPATIKKKVLLPILGSSGYENPSQCNVVPTLSILFTVTLYACL